MTSAALRIVEFTDPTCPFAFSAEPFKRKLQWQFGEALDWDVRLVGLSSSPDELEAKGFTTEKLAHAQAHLAEQHGMPIDSSERPRLGVSMPACRAVVAARLNAPDRVEALLRSLRVQGFSGDMIDEPEVIAEAARRAGIDPGELSAWMEAPETGEALERDLAEARHPTPEALAQDHKLAGWEGGRRYTCPSYVMSAGEETLTAPGFQPWAVYEVAAANLAPGFERRPAPESAAEVLGWAPFPLATREVAVVMGVSDDEAREQLSQAGEFTAVGNDGYWSAR